MQHQSCLRLFRRTKELHHNLEQTNNEESHGFARWLIREKGYKKLLHEHCALARLIAHGIECWVKDTSQLIQRFTQDNKEFSPLTGSKLNTKIARIEDGLSDPHCGKQFVKRLSLSNGSGIIYKPRDISSLRQLSRATKELNEHNAAIKAPLPRCLAKKGYGWVELIKHKPCESKADVEAYFHQCGQLTAILYLTRTNDIHHENLIASGRNPTLIDGDTIFYPGFLDLFKPSLPRQHKYVELAIEESVLSSGLLPLWDNINGELRDSSGIGVTNSDTENAVLYKGQRQQAYQYSEHITSGFREVMQYSLRNKEYFKTIINSFKDTKARAIYRPTRIYERARQSLLSPKNLIDGITRSTALEKLKSPLLKENRKPQAWELVNNEAEMLFSDDIPIFTITCGTGHLELKDARPLPMTCGIEIATARVDRLTDDFIAYQEELIQASCLFSAKQKEAKRDTYSNKSSDSRTSISQNIDATRSELCSKTAETLIERLLKRSHHSPHYGSSWIGINILEEYGKMQLSNAGLSLYNGSSGIVLPLAAQCTDSTYGEPRTQRLLRHCQHALQPILDLSANPLQAEGLINAFGLGGMTGLGSLIYSCTVCGQLLHRQDLFIAGENLSHFITPEIIEKETCSDIMSGLAGLLISVLELNKQLKQKRLQDISVAIGERICSLLRRTNDANYAWPNPQGIMLLGLSHGSAGIAMALFRLFERTGLEQFKNTALKGVTYENSKRDPQTGHWLDLRNEKPAIMNSWCNGAPGIGLARLAMYKISPSPQLLEDIEQAIDLVLRDQITELDQLCCGALGHCELLLSAGLYFDRDEWVNAAQALAEASIKKASQGGGFRLLKTLPLHIPMPGFMQGDAGIAYQLLRISKPTELPSILAMEGI